MNELPTDVSASDDDETGRQAHDALQLIERVRDEVRGAADAKRRQFDEKYPNDMITSMISGISWKDSRDRLAAMKDFVPAEVIGDVDGVLAKELTIYTIEQLSEDLEGPVLGLREAWETQRKTAESDREGAGAPQIPESDPPDSELIVDVETFSITWKGCKPVKIGNRKTFRLLRILSTDRNKFHEHESLAEQLGDEHSDVRPVKSRLATFLRTNGLAELAEKIKTETGCTGSLSRSATQM